MSTTGWTELNDFTPAALPIALNREIVGRAMEEGRAKQSWVLAFVVGTKPCFNKVFGAVDACRRRGLPFFVIDAQQHFDAVLTHGLTEFSFTPHVGVNFQLRGDLVQKSAELFYKTSRLAKWLRDNWPDVTVVPVVNGDTILCPIIPAAWMFTRREKSIQNEAGLRAMSPDLFQNMPRDIALDDFVGGQWDADWHLLRAEPFPEQWDTFVAAAGCEHHMAPVELNREHLLREGYPAENIYLTGGVVVDALEMKRKEKPAQSIFEIYPKLAEGKWLRLDVHRKENLSRQRFTAIFGQPPRRTCPIARGTARPQGAPGEFRPDERHAARDQALAVERTACGLETRAELPRDRGVAGVRARRRVLRFRPLSRRVDRQRRRAGGHEHAGQAVPDDPFQHRPPGDGDGQSRQPARAADQR
jgi:hypothetical protein